jgi:hypothetical protein
MPNSPLTALQTNLFTDRIEVDLPRVANGATVDHAVALPTGSAVGGDSNIVLEARPVPDLAHGLVITAGTCRRRTRCGCACRTSRPRRSTRRRA